MKSIFRYIIFLALSASAVLASCSKDTAVEGNPGTSEENQGLRTIILQFSPGTKAAFDGVKSSFVNGDVIKLSNATQSADATVSVANGVASITTSLTGNLTAVYPSTAANVTGTGGPVGDPAYIVPAVQDGTMGDDSIIAVADITGPSAVFELLPAMEITTTSAVPIIKIKSLKTIVSGARTGTAAEINTEGTEKTVITVGDGSADLPNPCYVILRPGVKLTDLSFDAGEAVGMKGIPESTITSKASSLSKTFDELNVVALGNGYQISSNNWHPYVTIGGLKWATMNLGASTVAGSYTTCCGDMYQWGSLNTLYTENGIQWSSGNGTSISWKSGKGSGFVLDNMEYTNFSTSLPGDKDVVKQEWGSDWRMPTTQEFKDLYDACGGSYTSSSNPASVGQGVYWCSYDGVQGCLFCDGTNKLFFPAEGWGSGTQIRDVGSCGHYWATSTSENYACYMRFISGEFNWQFTGVSSNVNYFGLTIRAVADQ